MRLAIATFFALLAATLVGYGAGYLTPQLSAPVSVAEPPKQAHHVVYFWVCDNFVGALLTTQPPIWSDVNDGTPNDEAIELMSKAISANHVTGIRHWHRGCPLPLPDLTERV